jgi:hypothetical protein
MRADFTQATVCSRCIAQTRRLRLPATPATTAAPTAAVPTTISTAASAAFYFGAGLVYVQRPSAHLAAVKRSDCFLAFFRVRHFDKTETAGTASFTVGHDANAVHLPIGREELTQFVFTGIEIQISYKNVLHANCLGVSYLSAADFGGKRGGWLAVQIAGVGEQSNAWGSIAGSLIMGSDCAKRSFTGCAVSS